MPQGEPLRCRGHPDGYLGMQGGDLAASVRGPSWMTPLPPLPLSLLRHALRGTGQVGAYARGSQKGFHCELWKQLAVNRGLRVQGLGPGCCCSSPPLPPPPPIQGEGAGLGGNHHAFPLFVFRPAAMAISHPSFALLESPRKGKGYARLETRTKECGLHARRRG